MGIEKVTPERAAVLAGEAIAQGRAVTLLPVDDGYKVVGFGRLAPHAFTPLAKLAGEIGNTYVCEDDRWVVSLIVGYQEADDVKNAKDACAMAIDLTHDLGSTDTHWWVHDRVTGETVMVEQADFERED